eukprot:7094155-Pyramimonas_sp.AAC.1
MRSAISTLPEWRTIYSMLESEAERCLTLQDLGHGKKYPNFWKAPAFVENLRNAAKGFPFSSPAHKKAGAKALAAAENVLAERRLIANPSKRLKLQGAIIRAFGAEFMPDSLVGDWSKRWCRYFPTKRQLIRGINWSEVQNVAKKFPPAFRHAIWRTLSGAWITSFRMHDREAKQCIFQCQGQPDSFVHYWCCPRMWAIVRAALHDAAIPDCPIHRLG